MFNKKDDKQVDQKAADPKPAADAAAPKFEEIDLDVPSVSWEDSELIEGKIIDTDIFESERGRKRVFIVVLNGEPHRLIEQAGLRRLFEKAKVGDTIRVATDGWRELDGNNKMRVFKAHIAPGAPQTTARDARNQEMRNERPSRRQP